MSETKDGGQAFPSHPILYSSADAREAQGMSLRDYYAIHADQPGVSEIVAAAGMVWSDNRVWQPDDGQNAIGSFDKWWSTLPLDRRFQLYAQVRFMAADAMLAAREATNG